MGEQDPDLNRITEWLTAKGAALAKASADVMPLLERLVVQELIRGHNDEASLSLELLGRFHQDRDLRWQLVEGLPSWWRQNCMRSDKVDLFDRMPIVLKLFDGCFYRFGNFFVQVGMAKCFVKIGESILDVFIDNQIGGEVITGAVRYRCVISIRSGNYFKHFSNVRDIISKNSDLIK